MGAEPLAGADSVNPPEQGIALYESVGASQKALHVEEGAKHYDMYNGTHFDNIVKRQIDWFKAVL
jgi:fermentation-respiration switch protein FrsA (DUF1100 family)|nr:hypothetical protein [Serratia fonticola]